MRRNHVLAAICCIVFSNVQSHAQTRKTIDSLTRIRQACLDTGERMPYCTYLFLTQMDSLLVIVYDRTYASLSPAGKHALEKEQREWMTKRAAYFVRQDTLFNRKVRSEEWGPDMRMITYSDKADFLKQRILTLLKRGRS